MPAAVSADAASSSPIAPSARLRAIRVSPSHGRNLPPVKPTVPAHAHTPRSPNWANTIALWMDEELWKNGSTEAAFPETAEAAPPFGVRGLRQLSV
ncbi:hypothetical protein RE9431_18680 [Prescottella equi]|nr:hypothetical protein RE9431_18680 [Prescottella equi]BCN73263.1 hypothetical protein RE0327_18620 [Prescottella equi]BCN83275.1 hypothetical protein RE0356_19160 [Prescottella equi]